MKIETKRRIIYFIKQILNYYEKPPYVMIEERRILTAKCRHLYPDWEMKMIDNHQIEFGLNFWLIDDLMKHKAIKYTYTEVPEGTDVVAEIKFILP